MALWRYVAIPENKKKSVIFCIFLVVALWRYVAICGDTPKIKKTVFFEVFFLRLWRCGDMWRYPKTRKYVFFVHFLVVALWRYVAMCGDTPKIKQNSVF